MEGIVPDDKDWTVVLDEICTECAHDVRSTTPEEIVDELPDKVDRYLLALHREHARERTDPSRWSVQEYVVHVAEMLRVMVLRFNLMLAEDEPTFPNWDQDEAAEQARYNELDPEEAASRLRAASAMFMTRLDGISPHEYSRKGLRSNGAAFTVASLAQYAWHDVLHHLWDIKA